MAPLEPHEKVLVNPDFLETEHGEISCTECHGGNENTSTMGAAHAGMVADPTFPDPTDTCGQCHEEEAKLAKSSLHYTLATYKPMVHKRAATDSDQLEPLNQAMDNHCFSCHARSKPGGRAFAITSLRMAATVDFRKSGACTPARGSRVSRVARPCAASSSDNAVLTTARRARGSRCSRSSS